MRYFGHIKDNDTENRITYVKATNENEARLKIEKKLIEQKRETVLSKWRKGGKRVRLFLA